MAKSPNKPKGNLRRKAGKAARMAVLGTFLVQKADAHGIKEYVELEPVRENVTEAYVAGEGSGATKVYPKAKYHGRDENWETHKDKKALVGWRKRGESRGWIPVEGPGGRVKPPKGPTKSQARNLKPLLRPRIRKSKRIS